VITQAKIAYILDWKFSPDTGVAKKVINQINSWRDFGLEADLVVTTLHQHKKAWSQLNLPTKVYSYSGIFTRSRARNRALRYIKSQDEIEGIYVRFGIFGFPLILSMLKKNIFLELNFKGFDEYKRRSTFLYLYLKLSRKFIFMHSLGACAVTQEIFEEFYEVTGGGVRSEVFPNSISLDKSTSLPANLENDINLIFIGSPGLIWHGVDRIIQLSEIFQDFKFHVVGPEKPNNIFPSNIVFPGELYGEQLLDYLANMDIGISSLAMDRNKLKEGSPLKTREYLAAGLPVIAGYKDTAISSDSNYFLNLADSEWPLSDKDIQRVKSFVYTWKGHRVSRDQVRSIDSKFVERERVNFIVRLLRNGATWTS
jgi:glycosyltransferase involved in cell wall biosynthesis